MDDFSEELRTFILAQLFHNRNAPWDIKEKDLFLKFFFKSPACYSFMISVGFKLPSVSTIYRWHSEIRLPAGYSKQIADMLTQKAKDMTPMDRKCVLIFDEMSIRKELEYNIKDDIVYGLTDFGECGRNNTIASKVTVFTLRGLNTNWKQTVAYYVGSPKGEVMAKMISTIITGVINSGLNVVATSCDQGSNNVSAYKYLVAPAIPEYQPYMEIENHRIFVMHDYPHLIKSVRNILLKYRVQAGDDIVDWRVLEKIFEEDSKGKAFKVFFKLSKSHIKPNEFEKLSVKLATQVFSDTVYTGIMYAVNSGCFQTTEEKKVAEGTAKFIKKMNDLFDTLNRIAVFQKSAQTSFIGIYEHLNGFNSREGLGINVEIEQ